MHAVLQSEDDRTRQAVTVILGKDNSPTPLVEHMRVHHHTDYEEVLRGNKLGLSVCDFTYRHWKEQLVGLIAEQYLSFAIVDSPAFRMVQNSTWKVSLKQ